MTENEYDVQDLEGRSGISVRNIRYYTEQELLPPPIIRGKQAYYTTEHLQRLKLIKRFRDRHFSLESIKGILSQLKRPDVESLLDAQDKVNNLSGQPLTVVKSKDFEIDRPTETVEFIDYFLGNQPEPTVKPEQKHQGESWEHISLAPGIELHVHQPVDPADLEKINVLIKSAHDLFTKRKRVTSKQTQI